MVRKALTEPLICAELCCLKDMATRCPFGWKSRFQSNLSILEAKNVSAPCATRETLGQTLLRDTFTALYWASSGEGGGWLFAILSLQLYFINLIYKYQAIHFFFPGKSCLCATRTGPEQSYYHSHRWQCFASFFTSLLTLCLCIVLCSISFFFVNLTQHVGRWAWKKYLCCIQNSCYNWFRL